MKARPFLLVAALLALSWTPALRAQPVGRAQDFRFPLFSQNRQTGMLTGTGADTRPDGTVSLATARVEQYDAKGRTNANIIVLATNCAVDLRQSRVWSADGLRVMTADSQLTLEGVGFTWSQTNSELVVSNRIRTLVRKNPERPEAGTLSIHADSLRLNYLANVATYTGHVQIEDPELEVACGELTIRRSESGKFDRLLAEREVRIVSRRDGSQTTSERAEYVLASEGEVIELTGEPRWHDATREAKAQRFVFRRSGPAQPQVLQALGEAWLKLPAGTNDLAGGWAPGASTSTTAQAPDRFLELSAAAVSLILPSTNGPVQSVLAETNVVIQDAVAKWQATAARATFTNAVLELTGDPVWTAGDRLVRGDVLWLNTADRSFAARGHALVRFPAVALGEAGPGLSTAGRTAFALQTNHVIVVESDSAEFSGGRLRFTPPVRASLLVSDQPLGRLECHELTVAYRQRLQGLEATGDVRIEQFALPDGPALTRELNCATLRAEFDEAGLLRTLTAEGGLTGWQRETRPPRAEPIETRLRADHALAQFVANTNRLEVAIAEGGVRLERDQKVAQGERVEFTGENGLLTLTGRPLVTTPDGRIADARALYWDSVGGKFRGVGPVRIEWTRLPTNVLEMKLKPLPTRVK